MGPEDQCGRSSQGPPTPPPLCGVRMLTHMSTSKKVAVMAHTFNSITLEAGAGGSVSSRKDRLHRDILPQSKTTQANRETLILLFMCRNGFSWGVNHCPAGSLSVQKGEDGFPATSATTQVSRSTSAQQDKGHLELALSGKPVCSYSSDCLEQGARRMLLGLVISQIRAGKDQR